MPFPSRSSSPRPPPGRGPPTRSPRARRASRTRGAGAESRSIRPTTSATDKLSTTSARDAPHALRLDEMVGDAVVAAQDGRRDEPLQFLLLARERTLGVRVVVEREESPEATDSLRRESPGSPPPGARRTRARCRHLSRSQRPRHAGASALSTACSTRRLSAWVRMRARFGDRDPPRVGVLVRQSERARLGPAPRSRSPSSTASDRRAGSGSGCVTADTVDELDVRDPRLFADLAHCRIELALSRLDPALSGIPSARPARVAAEGRAAGRPPRERGRHRRLVLHRRR